MGKLESAVAGSVSLLATAEVPAHLCRCGQAVSRPVTALPPRCAGYTGCCVELRCCSDSLANVWLRPLTLGGRRVACLVRLSVGLFQLPRLRDQTQMMLLRPEHEVARIKSRRRLHHQPGG